MSSEKWANAFQSIRNSGFYRDSLFMSVSNTLIEIETPLFLFYFEKPSHGLTPPHTLLLCHWPLKLFEWLAPSENTDWSAEILVAKPAHVSSVLDLTPSAPAKTRTWIWWVKRESWGSHMGREEINSESLVKQEKIIFVKETGSWEHFEWRKSLVSPASDVGVMWENSKMCKDDTQLGGEGRSDAFS